MVHGLYADITKHPQLSQLIEEFKASENPLDTADEVAALRAMVVHLLNGVRGGRRISQVMIMAAGKLLSEVTKAVKRIEDVRSKSAVSRQDLFRILQEVGRGVDLEVKDEAVLRRIHEHWDRIRL
jgi:hypothetical protein